MSQKAGNTGILAMQFYMSMLKVFLYKNGGKEKRGELLQGEMVISYINTPKVQGGLFCNATKEGETEITMDEDDIKKFLDYFLPSEVSQWQHFYAKADYQHYFVDVAIQYLPKPGEKKGEFYQRRLDTVTSTMRNITRKLVNALPMPGPLKERLLPAAPPAMENYKNQMP